MHNTKRAVECSKIQQNPNQFSANTNFIVHLRSVVVQHRCVIFSAPALWKAVC